jgi:4-amino-4-deoxy-L-arabinose transferase-like glycosyltransferase
MGKVAIRVDAMFSRLLHHLEKGGRWRTVAAAVLAVHAGLLAWGAWVHSPTYDEVGFMAAGISHWQFARFDLYRVNPPLVRMVATVPVLLAQPKTDWRRYTNRVGDRSVSRVGKDFVLTNGKRSFWLFTLARWACIPFSLLGGVICLLWAREWYGPLAGWLSLTLWCFSPNVLAHGQLITTDVGATVFGVAASYVFWRWLDRPGWLRALAAGLVLGLAELTKSTWILLFGLWPLLWVIWIASQRRESSRSGQLAHGFQLGVILLLGLYVLNLGYGFEGSFQKLGDYPFVSKALGGTKKGGSTALKGGGRNPFVGSWLGAVPVAVPREYLLGIDVQKRAFEGRKWAYLRGEWQRGGWWYYYLYTLAIKVPLGTWMLVVLALVAGLWVPGFSAGWRKELLLLLPLAVLLVFVSLQTGVNHHLRYVLPIFPFAIIWMSKLARAVHLQHGRIAALGAVALTWSVVSSLWVYPHSLSYFNETVGGPTGGHAHLLGSNVEWGQDLLYFKRWVDRHPEARPLQFAYYLGHLVDPKIAGIEYTLPPLGPDSSAYAAGNQKKAASGQEAEAVLQDPDEIGPKPGWYAASVNKICHYGKDYAYFLRFKPLDMVGYSIYIYHITLDEGNRVRRELGLPELGSAAAHEGVGHEQGLESERSSSDGARTGGT